jgi:ribosomal protein S6--L-glutamate ligase
MTDKEQTGMRILDMIIDGKINLGYYEVNEKSKSVNDMLPEQKLEQVQKIEDKDFREKDNIQIIVLTNKSDHESKSDTAEKIYKLCKEMKIPVYTAFVETAYIEAGKDGTYKIFNIDDKTGFELNPNKTVAIARRSVAVSRSTLSLVAQLERLNIFCINSRETIEICFNKYLTYLKLVEGNLPRPRTALLQNIDTLDHAVKAVGGKYPIVAKTLTGTQGIGVFFIESERSLKSVMQAIWKLAPRSELLIQEYIESDFDLRIHVLGGKVIASMKRKKIEGDFRSNYSLGGKVEAYKITKEEEDIAIRAAQAIGGFWVGVDMILDKKGKQYILEINNSPGTEGIEKATGIPVAKKVLEYIQDQNNWVKRPIECGYKEVIHVDGIGKVAAKFDTGNGASSSIHATDIKVDEKRKTISWKTGSHKFERPLKYRKMILVGGLKTREDERPVVELDVKFNNLLIKGLEFTLHDRHGRIPVLFDRETMKKFNVTVNPANKYVITNKEDIEYINAEKEDKESEDESEIKKEKE